MSKSRTKSILWSCRYLICFIFVLAVGFLRANQVNAYSTTYEISKYANNYNDAKAHVDEMCKQGYPVGHGGYVYNIKFNDDTGVITWSIGTIHKRCNNNASSVTQDYAVTGYDGICPVAGWYHAGSADTHDCIKYQNPNMLVGVAKCPGQSQPINTCSGNGGRGWWNVVYSSAGQPPSNNYVARNYSDGFQAQIPNWNTAKHSDGSYTFINGQRLCSYYISGGTRHEDQGCQVITAKINWKAEWATAGSSWISAEGRNSDGTSKNGRQGADAIPNARPGQILYWDHYLDARGPDNIPTSAVITAHIDSELGPIDGNRNWEWNSSLGDQVVAESVITNQLITPGAQFYANHNESIRIDRRIVSQDDVDRKICQRISWAWTSWNTPGWGHSNWACANVPYHYPPPGGGDGPGGEPSGGVTLSTSLASSSSSVLPGEDVVFNYQITNETGPTKTKGIQYRAYVFRISGSKDLPSNQSKMVAYAANWSSVACGGRDVGSTEYCIQGIDGTTGSIYPGNSWTGGSGSVVVQGSWLGLPGDQICSYITADNNWSVRNGVSSNSYAASNIACVKIGKKPQIQLNGSDSYAANGFQGSSDLSNIAINYNRGSYSQYGLLTNNGTITNFGSAGYTTIHYGSLACKLAYANNATFNNNCSLIGNGKLAHTLSVPTKPAGSLPGYPGSLGALATGTNYYYHNGDLTINGGSLNPNVRATIFVKGNVTINGNISSYNNNGSPSNGNPTTEDRTFSNLASIPSLTIVSENGNISVSGNVTLVDANLVATRGQFISCANSNGNSDLGINPSAKCTNKLKVNGSVVSKNSPKFHRTYGSGNTNSTDQWNNDMTNTTSEWFNYTPNAWLTPFLGGGTEVNGYNTTTEAVLPTRF